MQSAVRSKRFQQVVHNHTNTWRNQGTVGILDRHLVCPRVKLTAKDYLQLAGYQMVPSKMHPHLRNTDAIDCGFNNSFRRGQREDRCIRRIKRRDTAVLRLEAPGIHRAPKKAPGNQFVLL